jgi:acyl transferase domain-containing protein
MCSNGHTPGITLPGVQGQESVIRKAYASARLDPRETIYVEVCVVRTMITRKLTSI